MPLKYPQKTLATKHSLSLWRRDLVANMIGHFMIDIIGIFLPRLLGHPHSR
jgi:hypothetical protein